MPYIKQVKQVEKSVEEMSKKTEIALSLSARELFAYLRQKEEQMLLEWTRLLKRR